MCVNIIISMGSLVKRIGMTSIEETWSQLSGFAIERRPVTAVQVVEMAGPVDLYVRVGDPYLIVGVDGPEMLASLRTETDGCGLRIWQEPPRRSAPPALTVVRMVNGRVRRDAVAGEVIEYGDPDNTGQDLKGYNQVAYRTEAVLAYAVLDPKAFAILKTA